MAKGESGLLKRDILKGFGVKPYMAQNWHVSTYLGRMWLSTRYLAKFPIFEEHFQFFLTERIS